MPSPLQLVIFGASGDLTRRKLVPALTRLDAEGHLKREFSVIGVARRPKSDEEFRRELVEALDAEDRGAFETLAPRIHYHQGDAKDSASLAALAERLDALPGGSASGRLFYLSLKPDLFGETARALAKAGLTSARPGRRRPGAGSSSRSPSATTWPAPAP
jgi:glucose-6-phosphate 1-dehydrogenase